jgi:hypothetical protein
MEFLLKILDVLIFILLFIFVSVFLDYNNRIFKRR